MCLSAATFDFTLHYIHNVIIHVIIISIIMIQVIIIPTIIITLIPFHPQQPDSADSPAHEVNEDRRANSLSRPPLPSDRGGRHRFRG